MFKLFSYSCQVTHYWRSLIAAHTCIVLYYLLLVRDNKVAWDRTLP